MDESVSNISKWTVEEVVEHFRKFDFPESVLTKIRDEELCGQVCLEMKEEEFQCLNLRLGHQIKFRIALSEMKMQQSAYEKPEDPSRGDSNQSTCVPTEIEDSLPVHNKQATTTPSPSLSQPADNSSILVHSTLDFAQSTMPNFQQCASTQPTTSSICQHPVNHHSVTEPITTGGSQTTQQSAAIANVSLVQEVMVCSINKDCLDATATGCSRNHVLAQKLPSFNVENILMKKPKGKGVINAFKERDRKFISTNERIIVVELVVEYLVEMYGHYPATEIKEQLAKDIVASFPCLASRMTEESLEQSYSHFYNKTTGGFIETKLKYERSRLPQHKKKRQPSKQPPKKRICRKNGVLSPSKIGSFENPDEQERKIQWMKTHIMSTNDSTTITRYHEETFRYRTKQIAEEFRNATEIFEEYPRYQDSKGILIIEDMKLKYPDFRELDLTTFDAYKQKVEKLAERDIPAHSIPKSTDDDLLGFLLILLTHPEITKIKRVSKETLRSRIFTFIGANTDITDFVAQKPSDLKQPFLPFLALSSIRLAFSSLLTTS